MTRVALALVVAILPAIVQAEDVTSARGGLLRVLDKLSGLATDVTLAQGQSQVIGRLTVLLDDCRYPTDNPAADAYAHITVQDSAVSTPVFSGWMVASSPALSALDHPRYDVWVLRCDYPDAPAVKEGE